MSCCASHPEFSNKSLRGGKAVFEPAPVKTSAAILGILEAAYGIPRKRLPHQPDNRDNPQSTHAGKKSRHEVK